MSFYIGHVPQLQQTGTLAASAVLLKKTLMPQIEDTKNKEVILVDEAIRDRKRSTSKCSQVRGWTFCRAWWWSKPRLLCGRRSNGFVCSKPIQRSFTKTYSSFHQCGRKGNSYEVDRHWSWSRVSISPFSTWRSHFPDLHCRALWSSWRPTQMRNYLC